MELIITFYADGRSPESPLRYSAHCPGLGLDSNQLSFTVPLTPADMSEIRWYLEQYWRWPLEPDYERAQKLEASLESLGQKLWRSLFGDPNVMRIYTQFCLAPGQSKLLTIDTTELRVLALPWELLADEDGYLFSLQPPIAVRRRLHKTKIATLSEFNLPLRVLMVISRPTDVSFLDPRSSAVALLDALLPLGDQAVVEFLRPPTLPALSARLRNKGLPQVHVVHFDGHGVYDAKVGLGYLVFENQIYEKDPVAADRLGTLLNQCLVPLIVLDACQTGEAGQLNAFSSVAARLLRSGVSSVLAMSYSVLVETTRQLTACFYRELADGHTIGESLDRARLDLLADTSRHRLYRPALGEEETVQLCDWFLPVLYQQIGDPTPFGHTKRGARVSPTESLITRQPDRGGFPPKPQHGFYGRARELLSLERAFATHRIVVLHGFGGQGKTALATFAAEWLVRTRLFRRAVFFSFESGGGLEMILSEIGSTLVSVNFAIHEGDPVEAIRNALANTPTMIVLDNFESVLPQGSTPLPATELSDLLDICAKWSRQGESRVLLTTRDTDFNHPDFEPSSMTAYMELGGLCLPEALDFAGQILADRGILRPRRDRLEDLLRFLGCHPLSLQLVLPRLSKIEGEDKVAVLIEEFETLLPGFSQGKAVERNQSLNLSLEYSLGRLTQQSRDHLSELALFGGGAFEPILIAISGFRKEEWQSVRDELSQAALISLEPIRGQEAPYIRFHPTLAPYLELSLSEAQRNHLQSKYIEEYVRAARTLLTLDVTFAPSARVLAMRELPNLRRALDFALSLHDTPSANLLVSVIAKFLVNFGRWRERDQLVALVEEKNPTEPRASSTTPQIGSPTRSEESQWEPEIMTGRTLLQQGRLEEAEQVLRALLAQLDTEIERGNTSVAFAKSAVLTYLGRSLREQGRLGEALAAFEEELRILGDLGEAPPPYRNMSVAYNDLASTLASLGRFSDAMARSDKALAIAKSEQDQAQIAAVLADRGVILALFRRPNEARPCLEAAIQIFRDIGDEQSEASILMTLGEILDQERHEEEAEVAYRQALTIQDRTGDVFSALRSCNNLALLVQKAGRLTEAEQWCRRAIKLSLEIGYPAHGSQSNLALILLALGKLAEAESIAAQETPYFDEHWELEAASMHYSVRAGIADQLGKREEALMWRKREEASFEAFTGSSFTMEALRPIADSITLACSGDEKAKEAVRAFITAIMTKYPELAGVIRRILDGDRSPALADGLGRRSMLVKLILQRLRAGD